MRISKTRSPRVVKASGAVTATAQSNHFDVGTGDDIAVMIDATVVTGTSPSMTVSVQWSYNATDWFTADPADVMTAVTAAGKAVKSFTVKGNYARLNYAITGTTPSFTFAAIAVVGD